MVSRAERIALALLVPVILAASRPHPHPKAADRTGIERIAPADLGCLPAEHKSTSQLCAEWHAADAADRSVEVASEAVGVSKLALLLAGGTLVAAVGAAVFARRAALYTGSQSEAARRSSDAAERSLALSDATARRQLRAYVSHSRGSLRFKDEQNVEVELEFKNYGQTPAHGYVIGGMFVADYPNGQMLFHDLDEHIRGHATIGAGGTIGKTEKGTLPLGYVAKLRSSQAILYVYGRVCYKDIFDEEWQTNYKFFCGGQHPSWLTQKEGKEVGRLIPDVDGNEST